MTSKKYKHSKHVEGFINDLKHLDNSMFQQDSTIKNILDKMEELENRVVQCEQFIDRLRLIQPATDSVDISNYEWVKCDNSPCQEFQKYCYSNTYSCTECKHQLKFTCPAQKHSSSVSFANNNRCSDCVGKEEKERNQHLNRKRKRIAKNMIMIL